MEVARIADGFWRWTAHHPAWTPANDRPDSWRPIVGSIYCETDEAIVLIDPLVPAADDTDVEKFWTALDRDVRRCGLPVVTLISNEYHGRSSAEIYRRYSGPVGAEVHVPEGAVGKVACEPTHTFGAGRVFAGGITCHFVEGLVEPEVAFLIPEHAALVVADAVLGAGKGQVRVAPVSWAEETEAGARRYAERFRASVRELLELEFDRLVTSHGDPVLERGREALAAALDGPAWGDDAPASE